MNSSLEELCNSLKTTKLNVQSCICIPIPMNVPIRVPIRTYTKTFYFALPLCLLDSVSRGSVTEKNAMDLDLITEKRIFLTAVDKYT